MEISLLMVLEILWGIAQGISQAVELLEMSLDMIKSILHSKPQKY